MTGQAALPLAWNARYGVDDYIVDACNQSAFDTVRTPHAWQAPVTILLGESQSGKTHLAHIFASQHQAVPLNNDTAAAEFMHRQGTIAFIDDVDDRLVKGDLSLETLFHLVNDVLQRKARLLLTARAPDQAWATLPDLSSRLALAERVALGMPDEKTVKAALQKLFADRGTVLDEKVLNFLALRAERRFSYLVDLVSRLDRVSLESGRKITVPMIQATGLIS